MSESQVVSYSELDTYRQCPLKWKLGYEQRWRKETEADDKRSKGKLWHQVMEAHYLAIQTTCEEHEVARLGGRDDLVAIASRRSADAAAKLLVDPDTGVSTPEQELIRWMFEGHLKRYGMDPDWQIVATEQKYEVDLGPGFKLKATLDLIARDRFGNLWVVDHKSCKTLPSKIELDLADQFGLYSWVAHQIGHPVMGSIHSAARTQKNKGEDYPEGDKRRKLMSLDDRFARTAMFRTEVELESIRQDAYNTAVESRQATLVRSSPDPQTCKWKCDFLDAHLMIRKGMRPSSVLKDMGFQVDLTRH